MEIRLARGIFNDNCTIGKLYIDGQYHCWTLEDVCREETPGSWTSSMKVPKRTAIPYGRYEVALTFSKRFGRIMPLLLGVPDFDGIRIHGGNTDEDTEGCPCIGADKAADDRSIHNSWGVLSLLILAIEGGMRKGKVFITIYKETKQ